MASSMGSGCSKENHFSFLYEGKIYGTQEPLSQKTSNDMKASSQKHYNHIELHFAFIIYCTEIQ
jgi:hypothetical protein